LARKSGKILDKIPAKATAPVYGFRLITARIRPLKTFEDLGWVRYVASDAFGLGKERRR
jgi:hypothetical protein